MVTSWVWNHRRLDAAGGGMAAVVHHDCPVLHRRSGLQRAGVVEDLVRRVVVVPIGCHSPEPTLA
jgi:hypothetical protein